MHFGYCTLRVLNAAAFHIVPTTPDKHERKLSADIAAFAKVIKDIGLKTN